MNRIKRKDLFTAFLTLLYLKGINFHTVTRGILYRSAQLTPSRLASYVEKHKIQSIVNLRGAQESRRWYRQEKEFSQKRGISHFDFNLSAIRPVSIGEMDRILIIMRNAPKPILIHCYAGADRTGLIAALWKLVEERQNPIQALAKQLCWMRGHFSTLHIGTNAMVKSFWNYAGHIKGNKRHIGQCQTRKSLIC